MQVPHEPMVGFPNSLHITAWRDTNEGIEVTASCRLVSILCMVDMMFKGLQSWIDSSLRRNSSCTLDSASRSDPPLEALAILFQGKGPAHASEESGLGNHLRAADDE